jgi:hypothetical protein
MHRLSILLVLACTVVPSSAADRKQTGAENQPSPSDVKPLPGRVADGAGAKPVPLADSAVQQLSPAKSCSGYRNRGSGLLPRRHGCLRSRLTPFFGGVHLCRAEE